MSGAAIPVNVVTGFLGSGKTTLLGRLLADPAFAGAAVLINEVGEIGLDHLLVEEVAEDVVLLKSGCICCSVRGDLAGAIRGLYDRRERGLIPAFDRLLIETTGLADPLPILATILHETVIRHHFRLGNVIVTVDALNGESQLDRQAEAVSQAVTADRLVVTKTDLAEEGDIAALEERLARLNPAAPLVRAPDVTAAMLLAGDAFDAASKPEDIRRWFAAPPLLAPASGRILDLACHDAAIDTFTLAFDQPLDWTVLGVWLTLLTQAHGDRLLRVKGVIEIAGEARPVVLQSVNHLVYPPARLARRPRGLRGSRLVFITRDLPRTAIEDSLTVFREALAAPVPA